MSAAVSEISMSDISRQKRFRVQIGGDGESLAASHTVGQAVEFYLDHVGIRDHGLRWTAFSRGVKLDSKRLLRDMPETDAQWIVMPEVSAGAGL
jgi:hypothetical protein